MTLPNFVNTGNANYFQITFNHRPAETGVTYHVQASTNLIDWADIASYAGSNSVLTTQAQEISRTGFPNENVTLRDLAGLKATRFLRVKVTQP
jgi:hypothetical protein